MTKAKRKYQRARKGPKVSPSVKLSPPIREPRDQQYWKRSNGDVMRIMDMSHLHLLNAARMILKSAPSYRAKHDEAVQVLTKLHGDCPEIRDIVKRAARLSNMDFMARFHTNFRRLWSEMKHRSITWVLLEEMEHPDNQPEELRFGHTGRLYTPFASDEAWGDRR